MGLRGTLALPADIRTSPENSLLGARQQPGEPETRWWLVALNLVVVVTLALVIYYRRTTRLRGQ